MLEGLGDSETQSPRAQEPTSKLTWRSMKRGFLVRAWGVGFWQALGVTESQLWLPHRRQSTGAVLARDTWAGRGGPVSPGHPETSSVVSARLPSHSRPRWKEVVQN